MIPPTEPDEKTAMVKRLRRIANELGTTSVSRAEFLRRSGVTDRTLARLFGRYNRLVEAAGLVPLKFRGTGGARYSHEETIAEIARVLRLPNSKLTTGFFERCARISLWVCARRFGSWFHALKATAETLDPQRDALLLSRIRAHLAGHGEPSQPAEPAAGDTASLPQPVAAADLALPATEGEVPGDYGILYGDFIHFRGLEHAPINEQGVIFLFGMICRELGYVVEILKTGFPDCAAKRQLRPGVWQRVRIEFEFRSRTFCTHGHDPHQCDVIICWENNWPDCPIEVQELKSVLPRLAA
jgi:Homing endonuclease associated repeat